MPSGFPTYWGHGSKSEQQLREYLVSLDGASFELWNLPKQVSAYAGKRVSSMAIMNAYKNMRERGEVKESDDKLTARYVG